MADSKALIIPTAAACGVAIILTAVLSIGPGAGSRSERAQGTTSQAAHSAGSSSAQTEVLASAGKEAEVPQGPPFPTNQEGNTYGAIPDKGGAPYSEWPDLIAVSLGTGLVGYVHKEALHMSDSPVDNPSTPEELLDFSSKMPASVPIYAPDGVTQLGTYRFAAPGSTSPSKQ